jgi:hypothetical protein
MYILYLAPLNEKARALYQAAADAYNSRPYADRDAGFDLFCGAANVSSLNEPFGVTKIMQQTRAGFYDSTRHINAVPVQRCMPSALNGDGMFRAYWMLPRSSISKTPMQLANSVGLIDAGYRGELMAVVRYIDKTTNTFTVNEGDRYFQLASPDLLPWDKVIVVDEIPGGPTVRGEGGFGSTG